MIALGRWTFAALGALFFGIAPRPRCPLCGERTSNLDAHEYVDHADGV